MNISEMNHICPICGGHLVSDAHLVLSDLNYPEGREIIRYTCLDCPDEEPYAIWCYADNGEEFFSIR